MQLLLMVATDKRTTKSFKRKALRDAQHPQFLFCKPLAVGPALSAERHYHSLYTARCSFHEKAMFITANRVYAYNITVGVVSHHGLDGPQILKPPNIPVHYFLV